MKAVFFIIGALAMAGDEADLYQYLERFDSLNQLVIERKAASLPIEFTDIAETKEERESLMAYCLIDKENPVKIVVYRPNWKKASDTIKEETIFHELGHCILKRDHKEGSVMSKYLPQPGFYEQHRQQFLNELFLNAKPVFEF